MPDVDFLRIAAITIAVRRDDDRVTWRWQEPISRFLIDPAEPEVTLSVTATLPPPATAPVAFDSHAVWRLYADNRIECRSESFGDAPYKTAIFNDDFTRGTIHIRPDVAPLALHPLDYPLDEVLIANLLGRGRGVELHSCGIIDRAGRGHLFVGVSGAGKTTTARLWEGEAAAIVSDDRVIVREDADGFWMYGTPWHGEAELSLPARAPLTGVYLLTQAPANAIEPLPHAAAVARLFGCTFPLFHDAAAVGFTLAFLERLAMHVPVRELRFTRDRAVVDLVLAEAA